MAYEIFKKIRSMQEYFREWEEGLTLDLKRSIYNKYVTKCKIFQRDNFKCQNIECQSEDSPLTLHHIKFQKNGGDHKERNGVTLCKSCHKAYHRAKRAIVFGDVRELPAHIRGHTFKLKKPDNINWKKVKAELKVLRKNLKQHHKMRLSWKEIAILMRWLHIQYDDDD